MLYVVGLIFVMVVAVLVQVMLTPAPPALRRTPGAGVFEGRSHEVPKPKTWRETVAPLWELRVDSIRNLFAAHPLGARFGLAAGLCLCYMITR